MTLCEKLKDEVMYEFVKALTSEEMKLIPELKLFGDSYQKISTTVFKHLSNCEPCLNLYTDSHYIHLQIEWNKKELDNYNDAVRASRRKQIMQIAIKMKP